MKRTRTLVSFSLLVGLVTVRVGGGLPARIDALDKFRAFSSPFGRRSWATRLRYIVRALGSVAKVSGVAFVAVQGRGHAEHWLAQAKNEAVRCGHRTTECTMLKDGVLLSVLLVHNTGVARKTRIRTYDRRLERRNERIQTRRHTGVG